MGRWLALPWIVALSISAAPGCRGCAATPVAQTIAPSIDAGPTNANGPQASPIDAAPDAAAEDAAAPDLDAPPAFDGVSWGPNGRSLATWSGCACTEGTPPDAPPSCAIRVWDLGAGQVASTFMTRCTKRSIWARWSPSGELFAISNHDTLRVLRLADGALLFETEPLPEAGVFHFSPDGRLLLWGNLYGSVQLLRPETGAVVRAAQVLPLGVDGDWHAQWSPDGRLLTVGTENGPFFVWDGRTGAPLRELRVPGVARLDALHYDWLPGGERVVLASDEGLLAVGNARTGAVKVLRRPTGTEKAPLQTWITLRDDGKELAVNNGDGRIELWDMGTLRPRELLAPLGSTWTSSVEFSGDFQHLALVRQGALELVPTARPADLHRISLGDAPAPYQLIGWGADGRYYAVTSGALIAWTPDGVEVFRQALPDPEVGVRLSPGGSFALFIGRALDIVRLREHRSARLGVADAETLRALFDEAP